MIRQFNKLTYLISTTLLIIFASSTSYADYRVDSISDNMTLNVDAVVRTEQALVTVISPQKFTMKVKKAITILNDNASDFEKLVIEYSSLCHVSNIAGRTFDAAGQLIRHINLTNITDIDDYGSSLYEDSRRKIVDFEVDSYPCTIEYEYELTYESAIYMQPWSFIDYENVSVLFSGIQVVVPKNLALRYKTFGQNIIMDSIRVDDNDIYTWMAADLKMNRYIPYLKNDVLMPPHVIFGLSEFKIKEYTGTTDSWKNFGKWITQMNKGRDILPQTAKEQITNITKSAKTNEEKIELIYKHLQNTTRYVSVQIGIGGYQTIEAAEVYKNGYGDCKALSNYMKAMLDVVGIKSYYTLVKSGVGIPDILPDLPINQFDHVILCVPNANDTIWLECTDQTQPFNYLGNFTDNRHVLLIKDDGGELVSTPAYENVSGTVAQTEIAISNMGDGTIKHECLYNGLDYDFIAELMEWSYDKQKKIVGENFTQKDIFIDSLSISQMETDTPSAKFNFNAKIKHFAIIQNDRLIIEPFINLSKYFVPFNDSLRRDDIAVKNQINDTETNIFEIPYLYKAEIIPENIVISSDFGEYKFTVKFDSQKHILTTHRTLFMPRKTYSASKYNEFRNFLKKIAKADKQVIVFNKNATI